MNAFLQEDTYSDYQIESACVMQYQLEIVGHCKWIYYSFHH